MMKLMKVKQFSKCFIHAYYDGDMQGTEVRKRNEIFKFPCGVYIL